MRYPQLILIFLLAPFLGCAKKGSDLTVNDSIGINAYQDKAFSYSIGSVASGTYTISSVPAWVTFNPATGLLSGTPTKMSDTFSFTVTQAQATKNVTFGPYTVVVNGNPLKEYEWHMNNTGQTAFAGVGGTKGEDMHMTNTIGAGITGFGIRIAISDSGVLLTHEALRDRALPSLSRNYFNDYATTGTWLGDPTPDLTTNDDAHGTAVASLAAETGWNGAGGRGMAPEAQVAGFLFIPAQNQLNNEGLLTVGLNDQFAGPFDIFNYSWGDSQCMLTPYTQATFDKIKAGALTQRSNLGSIFLMAAGNSYVDDTFDCSGTHSRYWGNANFSELDTTPWTMIIGAINANGVKSTYSSPGSNIWVAAAGGEYGLQTLYPGYPTSNQPAMIAADYPSCFEGLKMFYPQYSDFDNGGSLNSSCNYTSTMNGTSSATPVATGAVALLLEANPGLSSRDVKYILAKTADKVDPAVNPSSHPDPTWNLTGHNYDLPWVTNAAGFHFHNYYGFGRINVDNAVALAKAYTFPLGAMTGTNWTDNLENGTFPIPDNSSTGLTRTMPVATSMTIESVQLMISISNCPADMGIELTSPSGTTSILMNINSRITDMFIQNHIFLSNAFYGENSSGAWNLKVIDGHNGCTGSLTNWALKFTGY
jgi:subtilisin family serine protease